MMSVISTKEREICNVILSLERPFKISQLLEVMQEHDITDKDKILEVLDQLCDSGVIKYSEVEDDQWAYKNNLLLV